METGTDEYLPPQITRSSVLRSPGSSNTCVPYHYRVGGIIPTLSPACICASPAYLPDRGLHREKQPCPDQSACVAHHAPHTPGFQGRRPRCGVTLCKILLCSFSSERKPNPDHCLGNHENRHSGSITFCRGYLSSYYFARCTKSNILIPFTPLKERKGCSSSLVLLLSSVISVSAQRTLLPPYPFSYLFQETKNENGYCLPFAQFHGELRLFFIHPDPM